MVGISRIFKPNIVVEMEKYQVTSTLLLGADLAELFLPTNWLTLELQELQSLSQLDRRDQKARSRHAAAQPTRSFDALLKYTPSRPLDNTLLPEGLSHREGLKGLLIPKMIEDDIYRSSTQYRYWSYTPTQLAKLRQDTNKLAATRVKAAIQKSQAVTTGQDTSAAPAISTLTVDEELKIVNWGCSKIIDIGAAMQPPIPMDIRATSIQYLRRFYITNSPMTYHPKQIMTCALYLATKSCHWHISLHRFVAELPGVTDDDVKAPEFLLMQGLRFTLDVRHPMRGLDGGTVEIKAMLEDGSLNVATDANKINEAASKAQKLLRSAAQMTDVYFLYTPSQIWLAALYVADPNLTTGYITSKFAELNTDLLTMQERLLSTIQTCASILESYTSPEEDAAERKEIKRIGKKLHLCQNPEKVDLIEATRRSAAEKREGVDEEEEVEKKVKKRKMERERLERDGDVFGPELKSVPMG